MPNRLRPRPKRHGSNEVADKARSEAAAPAGAAGRGRAGDRSGRGADHRCRRAISPGVGLRCCAAPAPGARSSGPSRRFSPGSRVMAQRPPLLALADGGGTDDLVKVERAARFHSAGDPQPHARRSRRSSPKRQRLEAAALSARAELVRSRQELVGETRSSSLSCERRAIERSLAAGGQALSAGDVAIAAGEQVEAAARASRRAADPRARSQPRSPSEAPSPPRPLASCRPAAETAVRLCASRERAGHRGSRRRQRQRRPLARDHASRPPRGAPVSAPADGVVRFSGPFRDL